jgi:WG containing repeat
MRTAFPTDSRPFIKGGWGYIDHIGNVVVPLRYLQARRFSEGVAPVQGPSGWLFVDKAGRPVDGLSGFEDAKSFSGGLAAVQVGSKWRFTTHKGQDKFELEFANCVVATPGPGEIAIRADAAF